MAFRSSFLVDKIDRLDKIQFSNKFNGPYLTNMLILSTFTCLNLKCHKYVEFIDGLFLFCSIILEEVMASMQLTDVFNGNNKNKPSLNF